MAQKKNIIWILFWGSIGDIIGVDKYATTIETDEKKVFLSVFKKLIESWRLYKLKIEPNNKT